MDGNKVFSVYSPSLTALIPQMTVVFPTFTKAEPSAVDMDPEQRTSSHVDNRKNTVTHTCTPWIRGWIPVSHLCSVLWFWILTAPVHQVDSFLSEKRKCDMSNKQEITASQLAEPACRLWAQWGPFPVFITDQKASVVLQRLGSPGRVRGYMEKS